MVGFRGRYLVVTEYLGSNAHGESIFRCECVCGVSFTTRGGRLRDGSTQSCGCKRTAMVRAATTKHGHSRGRDGKASPTYTSWRAMIVRCSNPNAHNYAFYGGAGVTVCDRWLTFENFLQDMGDRPPGMTIDRVDVYGNYEPGNCRWASMKRQRRNCKNTPILQWRGRRQSIADWAEELGLKYERLYRRWRAGWRTSDIFNGLSRQGDKTVRTRRRGRR